MHSTQETEHTPSSLTTSRERVRSSRLWTLLTLFTVLLLLALLPPLVNLGRYQRRVATSISLSLGRPVHLDHVSLNLLPLPSLTLENFVVDEDPAFGEEPIIRANTVEAKLRVASLWRRRVEFSRISFTDPSVNLVLRPDGRWNLEDVLLQAAHIDAAPTSQPRAGSAPRFPYIEATGARLNLKIGREKTPFSLTEADFALWLPQPQRWRMRLKAKPMRTDTSATDTGTVQMEATLDRAASLALVPLSLEVAWRNAPIGEAGRLLFGRDIGLRGSAAIVVSAHGTIAESALQSQIVLSDVHRADFVPDKTLHLDADCSASALRAFHTIEELRCNWPVPDSDGATIALTGSLPNVLALNTADLQFGTGRLPARIVMDWLRMASARVPASTSLQGTVSASISHAALANQPASVPAWTGAAKLSDLTLSAPQLGDEPLAVDEVTAALSGDSGVLFQPVLLPLGARDPALLEGTINRAGYTLHLSGSVLPERLLALAATLPPLTVGLAKMLPSPPSTLPVRVDLTASRSWGAAPVWTDNLSRAPSPILIRRH